MRDYQNDANDAIDQELNTENKCLVKMFCGTGKSLIMRRCNEIRNLSIVAYVFPSLALIQQFYKDYLEPGSSTCNTKDQATSTDNICCISSEDISRKTDNTITIKKATTDTIQIRAFIEQENTSKKYILITYQSYHLLLDTLSDMAFMIDAVVFDEAHHTVSPTYKPLVYDKTPIYSNISLFFTATPRNANEITMFDRNIPIGDCGRSVGEYTYLDGLNDYHLNAFEVEPAMRTIAGTARNMGITITGKTPWEN
jgi:predicted helicase